MRDQRSDLASPQGGDAVTAVLGNAIWKSGTHLLARVLELAGLPRSDFGIAAHLVHGRHRTVRRVLHGPKPWGRTADVGLELSAAVHGPWLVRRLRRLDGAQLGGHAAYSAALLDLLRDAEVRTIQIVRDPRAIADSFARWIDDAPTYYAFPAMAPLDYAARCRAVLHGYPLGDGRVASGLGTVLDRSRGWLEQPDEVLVVRFDDLVGPSGGGDRTRQVQAVARVCDWIGSGDADPDDIADRAFGSSKTFKQGQSEGWQHRMSPALQQEFYDVLDGRLEAWGYS